MAGTLGVVLAAEGLGGLVGVGDAVLVVGEVAGLVVGEALEWRGARAGGVHFDGAEL